MRPEQLNLVVLNLAWYLGGIVVGAVVAIIVDFIREARKGGRRDT